jgi:LysM repeat protein
LCGVCEKGWTEEQYIIKPGDTLYGISKSFGVTLEALKKANALERDSIRPKQVLTIPHRGARSADEDSRTASISSSKKDSSAPVRSASGETEAYAVQRGDSLFSLSKKVGLPIEDIKNINCLHTSRLKVGQILILPKEESRWDEKSEELAEGEEIFGPSERAEEKGESVASPVLGKWSNPEERSLLVKVVKIFLGVPYQLGGSTFKGIDCSALVKKIYEVFNIQLPRTTREQFAIGKKVEKNQLEEGDLVFFRESGNRAHVGIYVGDNQFVHASSYSREVKIDYLDAPYYSKRFLRGVRVKELEREI